MSGSDPNTGDEVTLPLAAERLTFDTRRVVTGRVQVQVDILTDHVPVSAALHGDRIEVTRVPVDREVTTRPEPRSEGDLTILPVLEEVLVVERRLILREEIHLRRIPTTETVETTVPLRREVAVIRRDPQTEADPTQPRTEEDR
jgi:stress response protein YsnF